VGGREEDGGRGPDAGEEAGGRRLVSGKLKNFWFGLRLVL
jgi:hypothetical protein